MANYVEEEEVVVQPYRGCWENLAVIHRPQFQTSEGLTDEFGPASGKANGG